MATLPDGEIHGKLFDSADENVAGFCHPRRWTVLRHKEYLKLNLNQQLQLVQKSENTAVICAHDKCRGEANAAGWGRDLEPDWGNAELTTRQQPNIDLVKQAAVIQCNLLTSQKC